MKNGIICAAKKALISLIETLLKVFWLIPLDRKKVMFISYTGAFSDSPKYTYLKLAELSPDLRFTWAVNDKSMSCPDIEKCKKVKFGSLAYIREICTSKVVITNNILNTYIPRRKNQYIINTWHGGSPLKTVGMVKDPVSDYDRFFYKKHAQKYSAFLSSSKFMTEEVFRKSFSFDGEIINCGLPRNAALYRSHEKARKKVAEYYGIPIDEDHGVVLYAPTFRGDAVNAGFIPLEKQLDLNNCIRTMEEKFHKKYNLLFRSHYFNDNIPSGCIVATDYPDMQELMMSSDILISDYSSCMGDMCLMYKPVFLYVPDLKEYIGDRGLYWDIFSLPFPVAQTEEEFIGNISSFEMEEYKRGVDEYLRKMDSYEGPDSDLQFAEIVKTMIEKENR